MQSLDHRYAECAILPVSGRTVFTVTPTTPLMLPAQLPRRQLRSRLWLVSLLIIGWSSFPTVTKATAIADDVFQATNGARRNNQLSALHHDSRLDASAKMKADDMFAQQYFAHASPTGQRGWNWMKAAGYAYTEAGENLAMDFSSGNDVVAAWMTSATHRENILSSEFTDIGVATVAGVLNGKKTIIIVAHFGRQTSPTQIAKTSTTPPLQTPAAPEPVSSAPPVSILETPTPQLALQLTLPVPSLVNPSGVETPTLTFTYLLPTSLQPEVLGVSTSIDSPAVPPMNQNLAWLILGALGLAAGVIGLASRIWPSLYPQALQTAQPQIEI